MILFTHDHKFIKYNDCFYSEGKFTNEVFYRYIPFDDKISILCRCVDSYDYNIVNLNCINSEILEFTPVRGIYFSNIFFRNFFYNLKIIISNLEKSKCLIVRLPSFLGVFVLIINFFFKKKYFIEFVGDPEEALFTSKNKVSFFFRFFIYIFKKLNAYFVRNANGVIYVTKFVLQDKYPTYSLEGYASNVSINIKPFSLSPQDYANKFTKFIKIGLIGSFNNRYKGIDTAFLAVKILRKKNIKIHLHILGSGSLKDEYLKLATELNIQDSIYFDGSLAGGVAVNNWLKSLDIYIQPSRTEGLPRALIEAMSVGLPCIATNVGGIPELLDQDDLVDKDNSVSLAEKIFEVVNSQQLRFQMGERNYKRSLDYDSKKLNQIRSEFWKKAAEIINESD